VVMSTAIQDAWVLGKGGCNENVTDTEGIVCHTAVVKCCHVASLPGITAT
jgi:hypothetical protein